MQTFKEAFEQRTPPQALPAVSATFQDGAILEMVHDTEARQTRFVLWRNGAWVYEDSHTVNGVQRLVPYSPNNDLIRNEIVRLPSAPQEYESEEHLIADIRGFIHRFVDVTPLYEDIATYYVLFSWIYDGFEELPYLRVRGDPGCGKTRFLLTVGALCYKAIFASGASTVAIDPTSRGFGFAVLEGPTTLIDWGVRATRTKKKATTLAKVTDLIGHYHPDSLVLENPAGRGSRRCPRIGCLIDALRRLADSHGVRTRQFSPARVRATFAAFGATTKHEIAHAVAEQLPELAPHIPRYRKPWMSEHYEMAMFDAVAMALTYYFMRFRRTAWQ